MITGIRSHLRTVTILLASAVLTTMLLTAPAVKSGDAKQPAALDQGQRVFTCGHSFHVWVPGIVTELCKKAEIPNHVQIGVSSIGGSKVIQHWNIAEEKNKA